MRHLPYGNYVIQNAIHLYDFDRDTNGTIYMAMEFISGKNLKEIIKDTGTFDVTRMLNIIFQICDVISRHINTQRRSYIETLLHKILC